MSQKTPHNPHPHASSRRYRRSAIWLSCGGILAAALIAGFAIDARLKSHHVIGRYPAQAEWVVVAADFGQAWRDFERSEFHDRLQPLQTDLPVHPFMALYKRTGIRLNPSRWNRWLGPKCVLAGRGPDWGLCVRPGLLGRLATSGLRPIASGEDAIKRYGEGFLAWQRDGFLVYASSKEFIIDWLAESAREAVGGPSSPALWILAGTEKRHDFTLLFEDDLRVDGRLDVQLSGRDRPLSLPNAWPGQPLVTVSGTHLGEVIDWFPERDDAWPIASRIRTQLETWSQLTPAEWERDQDEFSTALLALDDSQSLVVPEILYMARSTVPTALPDPPFAAIQYEWNGYPGWLEPWQGEKFSMYVAADNRTRFVANQEPIMARHVGRLRRGPLVDADLVMDVDLAALAAALKPVLAQAGENELVPRMNAEDVEHFILPWLDALALGGRLRLTGLATAQGLRVRGVLEYSTPDQESS